jgi:nephrocystin-3
LATKYKKPIGRKFEINTNLALAMFLLCLTPMIHSSTVLAAISGDNEMDEATQAENAGKYQNAERKYREAIEKFKDNKRDFPMSFALNSLGNLYVKQNQLGKAFDAYNNALEIRKVALARRTDDGGAPLAASVSQAVQKDLGLTMVALGSVYTRQKEFEKAENILSNALLAIKTSWGPQHDCVGAALAAIGDLRFAEGNYAEAEKYYRQAFTIRRKYHALNDPTLGALVRNKAAVLSALRKADHTKRQP